MKFCVFCGSKKLGDADAAGYGCGYVQGAFVGGAGDDVGDGVDVFDGDGLFGAEAAFVAVG